MDFEKLSSEHRNSMGVATTTYQEQLKALNGEGPQATYLKGRGLDGNLCRTFRIGAISSPLPGHEMYQGWLTIPYVTPTGVIAIKVRRIEDNTERSVPKYVQLEGEGSHLYNVRDLHKPSTFIVICEGEVDAMTMSYHVGVPCVAIPGVSNARDSDSGSPKWSDPSVLRRVFEDYDEVIIVMDGDDPGKKAADHLHKAVRRGRIVTLPAGSDVNEMVQQFGPAEMRKLLGVRNV